jgi:hypothetical protein
MTKYRWITNEEGFLDRLIQKSFLIKFNEHSTFVAALFLVFSFVSGGASGETLTTVFTQGGRLFLKFLENKLYFEAGFTAFVFLGITILFIGFLLSLYHPFSKRRMYLFEIRIMTIFAAAVTSSMAFLAYEAVRNAPFQDLGTLLAVGLTFLHLAAATGTLRYAFEDKEGELWKDHQSTLLSAVFILMITMGVGWWGVTHGWKEFSIYQTMLSCALLIGVAEAKFLKHQRVAISVQ